MVLSDWTAAEVDVRVIILMSHWTAVPASEFKSHCPRRPVPCV